MVGRFVQKQNVAVFTGEDGKGELCPFAARKHTHFFVHIFGFQFRLRENVPHARLIPQNVPFPKLLQNGVVGVEIGVFLIVIGDFDESSELDRGIFALHQRFE